MKAISLISLATWRNTLAGFILLSALLMAAEETEVFLMNPAPELKGVQDFATESGKSLTPETQLSLKGNFKIEGGEFKSLSVNGKKSEGLSSNWIRTKNCIVSEGVNIWGANLTLHTKLSWGEDLKIGAPSGPPSAVTVFGKERKGEGKNLKIGSKSAIVIIIGVEKTGVAIINLRPYFELTEELECEEGASIQVFKSSNQDLLPGGRYPIVKAKTIKGAQLVLTQKGFGERSEMKGQLNQNEFERCSLEITEETVDLIIREE